MHKVIEPQRGWLAVNWRELWQYRELIGFLTWRDVTIRYKQTILGITWAFIQPFIRLVVFSLVFGRAAKMDSEGFPYPIFLYAGLLPWTFFSEALSRSGTSVLGSANLVTKVYFPRLIIPISSVGACLADFLISFVILIGLMFFYGIHPALSVLAMLPLTVLTILAALGLGILLSALSVAYRDFRYILPFVLQIWMFVTPVVFPVRALPHQWQWLLQMNPMTGIVQAWRSSILNQPFDLMSLGVSILINLALFTLGIFYFRRVERSFADVV